MAPSTAFVKAEADRQCIVDQLNFLQSERDGHAVHPLTEAQARNHLEEVELCKRQTIENYKTLRNTAPAGTDMDPHVQEFHRMLRQASSLHSGFHGIVMTFPHTPGAPDPSIPSSSSVQKIKLPALELPKFSGNLQEWVTFRDMFTTAVHNSKLTNVEKLTQLKTLLTGEASRQVRSLILCDSNYDIAWKSLQERYENNRELLFSILKRLTTQPSMNSSSATSIRDLIDTTKECIRSLEVLSIPTQHWDALILYFLFSKLDPTSRELWEQSLTDTSIPPLSKMYEFLEQRARALAASGVQIPTRSKQSTHSNTNRGVRAHHVQPSACALGCTHTHPYFRCPEFQKQTPQQRFEIVKKNKLCHNCLSEGHIAPTCPSKSNCKTCNRRHHTLIHLDNRQSQTTSQPTSLSQPQSSSVQTHHAAQSGNLRTGILATAMVLVESKEDKNIRRALIDPGSTNTYITERSARALKLPLQQCHVPMTGLSASSVGVAKYITTFNFYPHFNVNMFSKISATALVVKSISNHIPAENLRKENWPHLNHLQLADPEFHIPRETDILIGTDIAWALVDNERREGRPGEPYAIKSTLGWLVAGPNASAQPVSVFNTNVELDKTLRRFWEQEEVLSQKEFTSEEEQCEQHFSLSHTRDSSGRFTVTLPLKPNRGELGASRQAAVRRFLSMERKFHHLQKIRDAEELRKLKQHWSEYKCFMAEYELLGHMELIPADEVMTMNPVYYIPHHSVVKESSTTTKLRVVFDASAATTTGTSLNDLLMVGPQLQDSLWSIMLRFRVHKVAFTADIAKMYRQIKVTSSQTDLQRIVWRDDPTKPLRDYRLTTVTYGTASAPYLAVKCLQQLAVDEQHRFPLASRVALQDFYMDDTASGCSTIEEAITTAKQLIDLCNAGGFQLRKWTSNSKQLLNSIPEELHETNPQVAIQDDGTVKTLGIYWNPCSDIYFFKLALSPRRTSYTKRSCLSEIAKIYDPLGWLSPAIIPCKIFMQDLWKVTVGWDDKLPEGLQKQWINLRENLQDLEKIQIPRCAFPSSLKIKLIGCCDASTKAISAVLYSYGEDNGQTVCRLLTSKTKVAPVKHVTLPRLELNAAVLLSELFQSTIKSLQLDFNEVLAFTDSMITLHWIQSNPGRWKSYVRRRVQTILDNAPTAKWYHIPGNINPADCASRGISASELLFHPLWWSGSSEVFANASENVQLLSEDFVTLQTEEQLSIHHVQSKTMPSIFLKYSSFLKLQRVIAFVIRFLNNWGRRRNHNPIQLGPLTVSEMRTSHNLIIRTLQHSCYTAVIEILKQSQPLPSSHSLLKLQPFMSPEGLIRVGGRLRHSNLQYNHKHPLLLPKGHPITTSIIVDLHKRYLHAGASFVLSELHRQYWVVNGRDTVRAVIRKCTTCSRHRADMMTQVMGDLPSHRITQSSPFSKTGIDYAGPFTIRPMVRSRVQLKCWLAIFVCLVTKGIHIEVVSSLSTDCFLAALRRFISRRGKPSDVFSDCGTNFKGAEKVLREFFSITRQEAIQNECSSQSITWHFNPPGAPHFGGLWEAGVKSIKHHLLRVMGNSTFTYEEMLTLVNQVEGILNSRPIVPASSDPSDVEALTPAHFINGGPLTALPEPTLTEHKENYLLRWQLIQQRQQLFWKRWSNEYLTRLQQRPKWMVKTPDLKVGHLVLIKDDRLPPLKWKLGRVVEVHPGSDGHVRVASLKTTDGLIKRPIVKLSLLPVSYE